jgi:4-amino-4-deoxy-L-arabinose transferase-like glycosyltransferase
MTVNKRDLLPVTVLLLLGSLAFAHLMALPAFEDEGSQLRLIWRAIDAGEWLQPLGEGKPLEAWLMVPLARLAPQALAAIRGVHVLAGVIGAVLTYRLALAVTGRSTAFASGLLFAVCPFVVYLQRLALSEMLLCAAGIWVLLGVIRFIGSPTRQAAVALASALVLAALAKLPVGFWFLTSMPLALLLMPAQQRRALLQWPALARMLTAHAPAVLLALAVIAVAIVRVQRGASPGFGLQDLMGIAMGRYERIAEVIGVPRPNLLGELTAQLSWPVVAAGLIGITASALLNDWRQRWLIAGGAIPMLVIGLLAKFWFSHYLLFTLPPLIIAAVSGWRSLALRAPRYTRTIELAVLALCLYCMGLQSARLILDPLSANWSPLDRFQYIEGWGSGYGYPEAAQFLLRTPAAPRMIQSLDGHSAYQLRTYLPAAWRQRVRPVIYDERGETLRSADALLANLLAQVPAWIIVPVQLVPYYMTALFGDQADRIGLRQIARFDKPGARAQLAIYEVTPR